MLRQCNHCGLIAKSKTDFIHFEKDKKAKFGVRNRCKICITKIARESETRRNTRIERRLKLNKIKDVPCTDCNQKYPPYVMDFDHLPEFEKSFEINGQCLGRKWEVIEKEIEKCEVVCSNCHRIRTHRRREFTYDAYTEGG